MWAGFLQRCRFSEVLSVLTFAFGWWRYRSTPASNDHFCRMEDRSGFPFRISTDISVF